MRAHSLRRTIWMANVVLGAGVLGVAAYGFVQVRPALADTSRAKPKWASDAVEKYRKLDDPRSIQVAPVSQKMYEEVDRPEFRARRYWIYSGPVPPAPVTEAPTAAPPAPKGLDAIGKPKALLYIPPEPGKPAERSVLTWVFNGSNAVGYFAVGEFIREKKDSPERFKLVDVVRPQPGVSKFKIVYDVYDESGKAVQTGQELIYDKSQLPPSKVIRDLNPSAGTGGTAPAGPSGEAEKPAAVVPGSPRETAAGPVPVVVPPDPDLPEPAVRDPDGPATIRKVSSVLYEVSFDDPRAYDQWKGKKVEDIAETIQTEETKGGIKITGLQPGTPAEWFGVRPGDKLVSINGQPASSRSDVIRIAQSLPKETSLVSVVIDRNGKRITFNVDPRDPRVRRQARHLDPGPADAPPR